MHESKTNRFSPRIKVTDKSNKEGLKKPVTSTGGARSFAVFERLKGEFVGDGTNNFVKATCISFRNRSFPTGSSSSHGDIRQQVLQIDFFFFVLH